MKALLEKLRIEDVNAGACVGPAGWLLDPEGETLVSTNPTTGEAIAVVVQPTAKTYDRVVAAAAVMGATWPAAAGAVAGIPAAGAATGGSVPRIASPVVAAAARAL